MGKNYLNRKRNRNFENTEISDYNCGGYALNTYNWYNPHRDEPEDREKLIAEMDDEGLLIEEIYAVLLEDDIAQIKEDFKKQNFEIVSKDYLPKQGERIIAYRIYIDLTEYYDYNCSDDYDIDYDFHFRFKNYNENFWREKNGGCSPRKISNEDYLNWRKYDSPIVYFKIAV